MFKTQNFCHIASNNRNQVKVGVFVYRTTDNLATVATSGYFNERIIDINLHDLIIHEKVDNADATKVEKNVLCVTERTLENVGTTIIKSKWEGDVETEIANIEQAIENLPNVYVKKDGTSVMSAPLKFLAGSMRGAVGPYLNGVSFWKMDSQGSITNIANLTDSQFFPVTTNAINLGNETHIWKDAYVARIITSVLNNGYDIAVPVTAAPDTLALKSEVDLAANSGRMITDQGVWYAKMYAGTTAPAAENGTNYADFSQTDGQGNPIIVIYERTSGAWVQSETITPPAEYDGYVPITSKIWDITEQTGQQGGRILWNHQSKEFTPYPQIISFDNIEVTGDSTVIMPLNPSGNQIVNKDYVDSHTPTVTYHPDLFDHKWADHVLNDVQWLRADTFSWQDGGVYEAAYNHLADEAIGETLLTLTTSEGTYIRYADGDVEGASYPYCWKRADSALGYTVYSTPSSSQILSQYPDLSGNVWIITSTGTTISNEYTETIAGVTITYYLADDGHKIVLADQESNVTAIYTATGIAWYYVLDTVNERFKLPRTKFGFNGLRDTVGKYIEPGLPNLTGQSGWLRGNNRTGVFNKTTTSTGTFLNNNGTTNNNGEYFDASEGDSIYGNSTTVQPPATQQYLYFYVGNFTQTAIENTAGLNASLFNNKADLDLANVLANVDFVIESQLPTAENNYTWYRKYRSGWVEQGGYATSSSATFTVNLPVTMSDTNYTSLLQTESGKMINVSARTTNSLTAWFSDSATGKYSWQVSGMAA